MNAPLAAHSAPVEVALPACLIVNPRSFRASRGDLAARAITLARSYGADVLEVDAAFNVLQALDQRLMDGVQRLFVLAGDGTIHAIVEHLARRPAGSVQPELLLLGGGRSNLTAAEFGGNGDLLDKLDDALRRHRDRAAFHSREHALLVLEQDAEPARHGFFVAAGLVDEAIRECHDYQRGEGGWLRRSALASPVHLLKLALLALIGRARVKSPEMTVESWGQGRLAGAMRILLVTTLEHRKGLYDPYAARGQGPLRVTAITSGARWFWLRFWRVVTGRFVQRMDPDHGFLSGRCERIELRGLRHYALDGEEFDADPTRPVIIRSGTMLRFLHS